MQSSWRSIGEFAWLFEVRDGFYHGTKQSREGWRWKYQIPQKEQVSDPTTFGLSGYLLFSLQNVGDHESWSSNFFEDSFWVQLKKQNPLIRCFLQDNSNPLAILNVLGCELCNWTRESQVKIWDSLRDTEMHRELYQLILLNAWKNEA